MACWKNHTETAIIESMSYQTDEKLPCRQVCDSRSSTRYVYAFILWDSGRVKIGVAVDPYERLAKLQTANPEDLRFLGYLASESPLQLEAELHRRFRDSHIRGEWFDWSDEILAFAENELNRDFDALRDVTEAARRPRVRRRRGVPPTLSPA